MMRNMVTKLGDDFGHVKVQCCIISVLELQTEEGNYLICDKNVQVRGLKRMRDPKSTSEEPDSTQRTRDGIRKCFER